MEEAVPGQVEPLRREQPPPPLHCTAAGCHGGAKMAVLAYSLGKREINQHFTIKNAKVISLTVVLLLLLFHAASRYHGGESPPVCSTYYGRSLRPQLMLTLAPLAALRSSVRSLRPVSPLTRTDAAASCKAEGRPRGVDSTTAAALTSTVCAAAANRIKLTLRFLSVFTCSDQHTPGYCWEKPCVRCWD